MKNEGVIKLKYIVDIQKGKVPKKISLSNTGDLPVYLAMDYLRNEPKYISYVPDFEKCILVNEDEILLLWDGSNAGEFMWSKKGVLSSTMAVIKLKVNINISFLFYQFKNFERYLKDITVGMGIPHVNPQELLNFSFFIPSFSTQSAIAAYLDRKTAQIDELISQKEQLLKLYEEQKTAIINQAVTKGINPNVKFKDSGIDWLGDIPEHWEVKRLRYLGKCQNGIGIGSDAFGRGFPFVSYSDVCKNMILPSEVEGLVESTEKDREVYSIVKGDVFFTRTSETIEEIAFASTCVKTIENAVFAGFLIRFRPYYSTLNLNFYKYYYRAQIHRRFFVKEMNLVTRASLSQELLKKLPVLIPPLDEQQTIGQFIETEINRINAKAEKTKKLIDLFGEYKQSLISEVVTGKIKIYEE